MYTYIHTYNIYIYTYLRIHTVFIQSYIDDRWTCFTPTEAWSSDRVRSMSSNRSDLSLFVSRVQQSTLPEAIPFGNLTLGYGISPFCGT